MVFYEITTFFVTGQGLIDKIGILCYNAKKTIYHEKKYSCCGNRSNYKRHA